MTDVGVAGGGRGVGGLMGRGVSSRVALLEGDSWETRAGELFSLCDRECKGFITKRDLQRLWGELPLGPDELEGVFDSLDEDHNGFLSLEEFTDGFGRHLGLVIQFRADEEEATKACEKTDEDIIMSDGVTDLSRDQLDFILDKLIEQDLDKNSAVVEAVWQQVCGGGADVVKGEGEREGGVAPSQDTGLGRLVVALMQELVRMKEDHRRMEAALAARTEDYNQQVSRLYEELESQITGERSKVALEHSQKEARALACLEAEVEQREAALRALEEDQQKMRQRLEQVVAAEYAARSENSVLSQHVEKLEADLNRRESQVQELQSTLDALKDKTKEEKRRRAHQALKVTEGIARERESLVTQLDLLRSINTQLRDEQDQNGGPHNHIRRRCREGGGGFGSSSSSSSASTPTSASAASVTNGAQPRRAMEGGVQGNDVPPTASRPQPPSHLPLTPNHTQPFLLPPGSSWSPVRRSSDCEHDEDYFNLVNVGVGPPVPPEDTTMESSLLKELLEQPVLCASCGGTNPQVSAVSAKDPLSRRDSMTQTSSPSSPRLSNDPLQRRVESSSKETETQDPDPLSESALAGNCTCERRDSISSVSSQHSATIIIYHPGPRPSSPDAHPSHEEQVSHPHPHPSLTRLPGYHRDNAPNTPPRSRHNQLGVRFSDELEVQFFEAGDGDGRTCVVKRQIVDVADGSQEQGADAAMCGGVTGCESEGTKTKARKGARSLRESIGDDSSPLMGKFVIEDATHLAGSAKKHGVSKGPKSTSSPNCNRSRNCQESQANSRSNEDEGSDSSSNSGGSHGNKDNRDRGRENESPDSSSQPVIVYNVQELEPRVTRHLNLHCMKPVFTLEGRRFVSEGQEDMTDEEEGGREEANCYVIGSEECCEFHHSKNYLSKFTATMGKDGRRVGNCADRGNNDINILANTAEDLERRGLDGKEKTNLIRKNAVKPPPVPGPPRMFKVVLIGDSGVGKTSFIHRACTGEFRGDFGCTVGVDYRVLELMVGGVRAVLQMWDTAGQERFRSITRQYYRKADGVVVMYDVTNEQSFLSVTDWLSSVRETAGTDVAVAVLGNKCDLTAARRVPKDTAYKMTRGHNCLMYEVSASSGAGVQEALKHLAALLATQEEHDLVTSSALELHNADKKKKICCRE